MKHFSIVVLFLLGQSIFGQFTFTKQDLKRINPLIQKGVKINNDEHKGISWIKSKEVEVDKSGLATMSIYFRSQKGWGQNSCHAHAYREQSQPEQLDFVQWNQYTFRYIEAKKGRKKKKYLIVDDDPKRDASGQDVTERSDVIVPYDAIPFVRLMANDPKPFHIRYSGNDKYYEKFYGVFLKEFKKKFGPVLETHDALNKEFGYIERRAFMD